MPEMANLLKISHQLDNPAQVVKADIAVFIPSFREASTIGLTARKAALGLKKFYPAMQSVIVNCDNHSDDGTKEAFFEANEEIPRIYVSTGPSLRGKGANLTNIFNLADCLSAKVVVILDANLVSIKASWLKSLIDPILNGNAEYVAPVYVRHKFDAPISKALVYPLGRALMGRRVMQPICVDHAFSGRLNKLYLNQQWALDDRGYKSDIKMLAQAVINQIPICQAVMAHPRLTAGQALDSDLPTAFTYVARAMFEMMAETENHWTRVSRSRPTALAGADIQKVVQAPQVDVDPDYIKTNFLAFGRRYSEVWREQFSPDVFAAARGIVAAVDEGQEPLMTVNLWQRAIFDAAVAYKNTNSEKTRDDLIAALVPLFLVKIMTSFNDLVSLGEREVNAYLESEAMHFETAKNSLVTRWKA